MLLASSVAVCGVKMASMSIPTGCLDTTASAVDALWLILPNSPCGHTGWRCVPMPGTVLRPNSRKACTAAIRPAKCSALRLRPLDRSWAWWGSQSRSWSWQLAGSNSTKCSAWSAKGSAVCFVRMVVYRFPLPVARRGNNAIRSGC